MNRDLSLFSPVWDDIIVSCLRERFMIHSNYTRVGSCALVVHKYIDANSDSPLHKYAAECRHA
jgi:hypothetical protein